MDEFGNPHHQDLRRRFVLPNWSARYFQLEFGFGERWNSRNFDPGLRQRSSTLAEGFDPLQSVESACDRNRDQNSDRYTDAATEANADSNRHLDADAYSDANRIRDSDSYRDANCGQDANSYRNQDYNPYRDHDSNSHSDPRRDAGRNRRNLLLLDHWF
jgi:hypothetical protein